MGPLEILESHRAEIEALCRQYALRRLSVFGSATRDDWDPERSDFDFAVEFSSRPKGLAYFGALQDLADAFGRVLGRKVDIIDWKTPRRPWFESTLTEEAREWYVA